MTDISPDERKRRSLVGVVLLLAFLAYANTLLHGFVYDDHFQIEGNPYVHSFRYVDRIFTTTVWSFQGAEGQTNYYRPLMTFGYLLCDRVFQSSPIGFHLVNLLLNCVVVYLVVALSLALFGDESVALVTAAIFAVHPVHTEVVAWIAAVTELDLAVFYLLAFLLFLRLAGRQGKRRILTLAMMSGSFLLALLSKEQAMTLPLVATLYEHLYREDRQATVWTTKVSRYLALWVIAAGYGLFRVTVLHAFAPVTQRAGLSAPEVALSGLALVGQYASKLIWPHPLLGYYVFRESQTWSDPRPLAGLAALAAFAMLFAFLWKRARRYSFALAWMAVTILPVLNVRWMAASAFAERYLYLPSFGFCALASAGGLWLWRRAAGRAKLRWALAGAGAVLLLSAVAQTVVRNRDWRDDRSFFTSTLAVDPHASYMRTSLATLEWSEFRPQDAVKDWKLALADKPDNAVALSNLGMAMIEEKRWAEAEACLRKAIELRPRFAGPHLHFGKMYRELGKSADAEREFRRAVEISPLNAEARNLLAELLSEQGRQNEAEQHYRSSLEAAPNAGAFDGLGDILWGRGLRADAAACWRQALELSPFDTRAHLSLGIAYQEQGRAGEAEKEFRSVLLMDPHNEPARKAIEELKPAEFPLR